MAAVWTYFTTNVISTAYNWFMDYFIEKRRLRMIKEKVDQKIEANELDADDFDFVLTEVSDKLKTAGITAEDFCKLLQEKEEAERRHATREDRITPWELAQRRYLKAKEALSVDAFTDWAASNQETVALYLNKIVTNNVVGIVNSK